MGASADAPTASGPCAAQIQASCRPSIRSASLDNGAAPKSLSFDAGGPEFANILSARITALDLTAALVAGRNRTVCIVLSEPCNSLDSLCGPGGCATYMADSGQSCCPTCPAVVPVEPSLFSPPPCEWLGQRRTVCVQGMNSIWAAVCSIMTIQATAVRLEAEIQ